jgi:hypothetical protein
MPSFEESLDAILKKRLEEEQSRASQGGAFIERWLQLKSTTLRPVLLKAEKWLFGKGYHSSMIDNAEDIALSAGVDTLRFVTDRARLKVACIAPPIQSGPFDIEELTEARVEDLVRKFVNIIHLPGS